MSTSEDNPTSEPHMPILSSLIVTLVALSIGLGIMVIPESFVRIVADPSMVARGALALSFALIAVLLIWNLWSRYKYRTREQEQMQSQSDYVATASHELRSPLTAIRWTLAELRTSTAIPPDVRTSINGIYDRVRTLIDLTSTFMLMASVDHDIRAKDLAIINISPIILDVLTRAQFIAITRKITIEKDHALNEQIQLRGDPIRLRLVFDNLVSNAIKYSPENTTVSVGFIDQGSMKTFFVRDQGIGIPEADIKNIFSGFKRAKNATKKGILGSGFGLYMAKKIVDFHRGTLTCESQLNKGTTFFISLPGL